jgi:hypothetical protein
MSALSYTGKCVTFSYKWLLNILKTERERDREGEGEGEERR